MVFNPLFYLIITAIIKSCFHATISDDKAEWADDKDVKDKHIRYY